MEPSKFRPSASVRNRPFSALVTATKARRRSSSMACFVFVFLEGKIPSFMPRKKTYGNSRPFAECTVIMRTWSFPLSRSLLVNNATWVK